MNKTFLTAAVAGTIGACTAFAEERIELNNIYPLNQEIIQLSDRIFLTQDNRGYYEVIEGPF